MKLALMCCLVPSQISHGIILHALDTKEIEFSLLMQACSECLSSPAVAHSS